MLGRGSKKLVTNVILTDLGFSIRINYKKQKSLGVNHDQLAAFFSHTQMIKVIALKYTKENFSSHQGITILPMEEELKSCRQLIFTT